MKFINYLTAIAGIDIYPLISLLIFLTFFVGVTIWAMKVSKERIVEMSEIPLNNDDIKANNN